MSTAWIVPFLGFLGGAPRVAAVPLAAATIAATSAAITAFFKVVAPFLLPLGAVAVGPDPRKCREKSPLRRRYNSPPGLPTGRSDSAPQAPKSLRGHSLRHSRCGDECPRDPRARRSSRPLRRDGRVSAGRVGVGCRLRRGGDDGALAGGRESGSGVRARSSLSPVLRPAGFGPGPALRGRRSRRGAAHAGGGRQRRARSRRARRRVGVAELPGTGRQRLRAGEAALKGQA